MTGLGRAASVPLAASSASANPFRILRRHRSYRIFWIGQTLSLVGSWMQTMAVGWLALDLSDSAFIVGLVASIGALPIVLFGMHAGALVDRGNRFRIVQATQAVFLAQAGVLWLVTLSGHVTIPILLILQFVQGLASAVEIPARQSMVIQLVGRDDLQPAIALNSSGFNLARVVGPAIGGAVIGSLGIAWCFGLNAASFGAVLLGLARISSTELLAPPAGTPSTGAVGNAGTGGARRATLPQVLRDTTASAADGLRYLLRPGHARDLLALVTVGAVFGGPYLTLLPVVARDQLGLDAGGYGGMLATVGVGGLLAALLVAGPISHRPRKGGVLMSAAIAFPLLLLAFAYTRHVLLAYLLLFCSGLAMIMWNALSNGMLQLMVEERYRGRLMAFYALVFVGLSQALGSLGIGVVAGLIGAPAAIACCAVVLLAASLVTMRRASFWRRV
ncbi:MFS transporter [Gemmatimonas sp.]|uniref:MFS transporter n=1 Tax=Gemmatimonas sp. TaxID=1962908 RepID=UPI0025BFC5EF|nr:MFS transporter [Gemmatimonas sp.]MCA2993173.1 MFS transporter [Gemmatimonas sp.]